MSFAKSLMYVVLAAGIANLIFMYRVGNSGGEIRHTEIRAGAAANAVDETLDTNPDQTNTESHDDDH